MGRDRLGGKRILNVGSFLNEFEKDEIKKKIDIVNLFEQFGIKLTRKGKNYTGLCPWHDDKRPSLSVSREKGQYNCFGCGESGDHFTLVEKMKGCDFKEALAFLKSMSGKTTIKPSEYQKQESPEEEHPILNISLDEVCEYYHKKIYQNKPALTYLTETRKIDPELIRRYRIGFADGTLLNMISNGQREALKNLCIIKTNDDNRMWEHFAGCITFPITDEAGSVVHFYGRRTCLEKTPAHLYLTGTHKSIFNRKASRVYDEIILVESIIDCLSLISMGIENVQALYGVGTLTQEHINLLKEDRVKTIVLAFDNDAAGAAGIEKHKNTLLNSGFAVKTITPPSGKDWNDCLIAGADKQTVLNLIDHAETITSEEPVDDMVVEKQGARYTFKVRDRTYTFYGVNEVFIQNLKVNIKAEYGNGSWTDNADMLSAKSRASYASGFASRMGLEDAVIENDLEKILVYFENKRNKRFEGHSEEEKPKLSEFDRKLGMELLTDKNVFETILSHAKTLGYAGQQENILILFIVGISRFQKEPLSIFLTGESSTGKTAMVRLLEKMTLEHDIWKANSISPEVLYYVDEQKYKNKIFLMGESTHDEKIESIVRQMQSDGEIAKLVTQKDDVSGAMVAEYIQKKVQMCFIITTTKAGINPENLSRCIVLTLDEDKEQIADAQKMIGLKHSFEKEIDSMEAELVLRQHHAAQRLLEPVKVFNVFGKLTNFPSTRPTMKRAFDHFLYFIDSVCYFRQKQKPWVTRTIPGTGKRVRGKKCDMYDYEVAYRLYVKKVLKQTGLTDIESGTRAVYEKIRKMVRAEAEKKGLLANEVSFMQKDLREYSGYRHEFVKKHIRLLLNYEYLTALSGRNRGTRCIYRIRDDVDMIELDISMITTPFDMREKYEEAEKQEKEIFGEEEEWE